jgi:hypothetical protein
MLYDPSDLWRILNWVITHGPTGGGVKKTTEAAPTELLALREPDPIPWMTAVSALVAAAGVLQQAENLREKAPDLSRQLHGSASASIDRVLDDYCGTPPHPPHGMYWPWPSPPPWVFAIAAELNRIANTAEAAGMQAQLLDVAGRVLQRGVAGGR